MGRRNVTESTQARRTGLVLIALLVVFAGVALWREHPGRAVLWSALAAGSACVVFAAPAAWLVVWRVWMRVAMAISSVITVVILGVCYYLLFMPVGLAMRLAGRDVLGASWRKRGDSYWVRRDPVEATLDRYRKQY